MPRSSKKRRHCTSEPAEPGSSSSSSSSDDEKDQDEPMDNNPQENIQIDLEARTPIDTDQSAIVYFLEQSFGNSIKKSILDLNQLATQLITQQSCGSVFYQPLDSTMDETDDDDNDYPVLGICSFLRFDQQLQTWLLNKCSDNEQAKKILEFSKCGLFINERYMNIPADISLPAIRTLREEIIYPIDYWIIHAKLRLHKSDSNTVYYINGEEEIFPQYSTVSIDYYPNQSNAGEWIHQRKIIFVSSDKLDQICFDIEQKLKQ